MNYFLLLLGVILTYTLRIVLLTYNSPLYRIPGPQCARWTRLWLAYVLITGKAAQRFVHLDRCFGPVVRIGPNHVLISDPESVRRVLAVGSKYTRGPWFDTLRMDPSRNNITSERDPKKHQQIRHVLANGIAGKGIVGFEQRIDEHIRRWIEKIKAKHVSTQDQTNKLDLSRSLPFLSVDIISQLVLGKSFECSENDTDQYEFLGYIRAGTVVQLIMSVFLELKSTLHSLTRIPAVRPYMTFFPHPGHDKGIGRVMREIQFAVRAKEVDRKNKVVSNDMLSSFLDKGLTAHQALPELAVVIAAGTDNFATATQAIILCIVTKPSVYQKLQREIDAATVRENFGCPISDSAARQLPYLQACISEGMRRMPPDTQLRERMVSPEGDMINGYFLPGGTFVGLNSLAIQNHAVYGNDPEIFRPERWLTKDLEKLQQMHKTLELLFSHGSSKCLGYVMTYTEIGKIVFELFRHFEVSLIDPEYPWKRKCRGSFIQSDFWVRIERRGTEV